MNKLRAWVILMGLMAGVMALPIPHLARAEDAFGKIAFERSARNAKPSDAKSKNFYWEEWNGLVEPRANSSQAFRVITVALVEKSGTKAEPSVQTIECWGGNLWPGTLIAAPGSTITIVNNDSFEHAIFAEGLSSLGPQTLAPGAKRAIKVEQAGDWVLRDQLWSHVRGWLHASAAAMMAVPVSDNGDFALRNLKRDETYTLKVFAGPKEISERTFTVHLRKREKRLMLDPITIPDTLEAD